MYKFDEWLGSCPIPFTMENDNGDQVTITFNVGELEEEERQQTHCSSCNKITNSSRADYQDEFTCNDCGAEVQEEE